MLWSFSNLNSKKPYICFHNITIAPKFKKMQVSKITRIAVVVLVLLFLVLSVISCSTHTHHTTRSGKIPPGQAKKMSGDKSAKAYAPGQQKKR